MLRRGPAGGGIILKLNSCCENNVVADVLAAPRGFYLSLREGPMMGAVIQRNIFYSPKGEPVFINELPASEGGRSEDRRGRALAQAKDAETDYNIYFSATDRTLGEAMLAKQQRNGVDRHSLAVDPLFVDPVHGDFRLTPNSPAIDLGNLSLDKLKVGLAESMDAPPP